MKKVTFKNGMFHNGKTYSTNQGDVESLMAMLNPDATTYEEDWEFLLKHQNLFSEKAYFEAIKAVAGLISSDTDDD